MKITTLLNPHYIVSSLKLIVAMPIAALMRIKHRNVWIITERHDQARDNGYCFFKYLRTRHPELEAYYLIDASAQDRKKIEQYGNIIPFDSFQHYLYFCLSKVHVSAHDDMCAPSDSPYIKRVRKYMSYKNVFLPHGVSYGVSEFCLAKYGKFDLFICSGKPEYDNLLANYGYTKDQLAYTGFPRLDGWHHIKVNPKQILLMPTWRLYLAQDPDTIFEETTYFKSYQNLISSSRLHSFLAENDLHLIFYLHHNMRQYVDLFHTDCANIEIVKDDELYDIQELLKSSALLITDYSSVHFDFAYMGKPVIYYQFDQAEFFSRQYEKSSFSAEEDGFGPVVYTVDDAIDEMKRAFLNHFAVESEYHSRMRTFYQLYDEQNCDRVYQVIQERVCGIQ